MPLPDISPRTGYAAVAAGSVGLVGAGLVLQAWLHLSPCPLCIFQRLLYLVIGGIALVAAILPAGRRLWSALIALVGLGGLATAAYQSWMQAFPHLAPECSFTEPNAIERLVDTLGMQWPSLFLATGFCTSREWEFLGLSMANWSVFLFAGFAGIAVWLARRR